MTISSCTLGLLYRSRFVFCEHYQSVTCLLLVIGVIYYPIHKLGMSYTPRKTLDNLCWVDHSTPTNKNKYVGDLLRVNIVTRCFPSPAQQSTCYSGGIRTIDLSMRPLTVPGLNPVNKSLSTCTLLYLKPLPHSNQFFGYGSIRTCKCCPPLHHCSGSEFNHTLRLRCFGHSVYFFYSSK